MAHVDVIPHARLAKTPAGRDDVRLAPVAGIRTLPYDHKAIVAAAAERVRSLYDNLPDPDRLLGVEFTLRELRLAHEAIAGRPLQRDTFRRAMEPALRATCRSAAGVVGRPADLFRRR